MTIRRKISLDQLLIQFHPPTPNLQNHGVRNDSNARFSFFKLTPCLLIHEFSNCKINNYFINFRWNILHDIVAKKGKLEE